MYYLSSPYSSPVPAVRRARLAANRAAAQRGIAAGHCVFAPLVYFWPLSADAEFDASVDWTAIDVEFILAGFCDALVVLTLPGWERSTGVAAEVAAARKLGIPVYESDTGLPPADYASPTDALAHLRVAAKAEGKAHEHFQALPLVRAKRPQYMYFDGDTARTRDAMRAGYNVYSPRVYASGLGMPAPQVDIAMLLSGGFVGTLDF